MKVNPIHLSPFAFLSLEALAHPGHEAGAVIAGIPAGYLSILLALLGLGLAGAVLRASRRRKAASADD